MQTTWVIAADASRARIFQVLGRNESIEELETFVHMEGRQMDRELRTDAQGQYFSVGAQGSNAKMGHAAEERTSPTEHAADVFSKTLSDYLEKARTQHKYDQLCLIAPPKFLGLLRQNLSKEAQKLVEKEIPKDISWFNPRDIESYIKDASGRPA